MEELLPLMGHRNWIVVTDMAYPLQTNPGITTLFASDDYAKVVGTVSDMIIRAPHVFAHVYQDQEQQALSEELVPTSLIVMISHLFVSFRVVHRSHSPL